MNVQKIYSRVKKIFPNVTLPEVVELINDAFDDGDDMLKGRHRLKLNVVEDKLLYALPGNVIEIKRVFYLNSDGNYKPFPRLIGEIDIGDLG